MELFSFFKKIFSNEENSKGNSSGSPKDIVFADIADIESIPFRFFLLVNAEHYLVKWDFTTIKNYLQDYFLSCPESKAFELTGYSHALVDYFSDFATDERATEWSLVYRHFHLRFQGCNKEQQIKFFRECSPVAMMYKISSETSTLGETFLYRLSGLEKFSHLSKDELAELFEEAREIANAAK